MEQECIMKDEHDWKVKIEKMAKADREVQKEDSGRRYK